MRSRERGISAGALALTCLVFFSCSGHAPELLSVEYRLLLAPPLHPGAAPFERLSVFAAVNDEDGFKDLAALHVLNDGEEYLWTLTPESWSRKDQGKEVWIGSSSLCAPDSGPLPRGLYRVVLEDLSGASTEASFSLPKDLDTTVVFPVVRLRGDRVLVVSKYPHTSLFFLDGHGAILRAVEAPEVEMPLDQLYGSSKWKGTVLSLLAYGYDPERNIGIYSWNAPITP